MDKAQRMCRDCRSTTNLMPGRRMCWECRRAMLRSPERRRARVESDKKYKAKHADKNRARHAVQHEIRMGRMSKGPCEVCGSKIVQAHHDDYSKLLEVRWFCHLHHEAHHHPERAEILKSLT